MTTSIAPRLCYDTVRDGSRSCPTLHWDLTNKYHEDQPEWYVSRIVKCWSYPMPEDQAYATYQFHVTASAEDDELVELHVTEKRYDYGQETGEFTWCLGTFVRTIQPYSCIARIQDYSQWALNSILMEGGSLGGLPSVS